MSNKTRPKKPPLIAQVKAYVGAKSGDISLGGAAAGKTKLANDYNAKNYAAVIADGDALKKAGALDAADAQVVAQAYYLSGNKAGCVKYVKGLGDADETTLQLQMKCAFDANDDADQRDALEQLVAKTGKADYWTQLLKMAEPTKDLTDHQSLDIYRLKFLTGTLASKDDYINMAQLDLQLGFPQEAAAVMDKGTAAGLLNDDRSKKLQALAKQQAAQAASGQAAALAAGKRRRCHDQGCRAAGRRGRCQGRGGHRQIRHGQVAQGQGPGCHRAGLGPGRCRPGLRRGQDPEGRQW